MRKSYIAYILSLFLIVSIFTVIIFKTLIVNGNESKEIIGEKAARDSNYIVTTDVVGNTYKTNAICSYDYSEIFIGKDTNTNGLLYKVLDPPECEKGEKVILVLDDMNTQEIYDDRVVAIEFLDN